MEGATDDLAASLEALSLDIKMENLTVDGRTYKYFDVVNIAGPEYQKLPFCLRIFYENCVRQAALTVSKDNLSAVWVNAANAILKRYVKLLKVPIPCSCLFLPT